MAKSSKTPDFQPIPLKAKTPNQQRYIDAITSDPVVFATGSAGTGKEQPVSTTIQTPSGPRRFGDLKIGDEVFGKNGKPTKVTGVFPQGVKPVYEIKFRDDTSTHCGKDHLWLVNDSRRQRKGNVWTTQQLIEKGVKWSSGGNKYQIPLCDPVEYPKQNLKFNPYLIGALIGDGYLCGKYGVWLTCGNEDLDIFQKIREELPEHFVISMSDAIGCIRYCLKETETGKGNSLKEYIRHLGLDVKSEDKFIPIEYLQSNIEDRTELLKGLMDTDGTSRGNRISYSTVSMRLARDIQKLVQSLGGTAILHSCDRTDEGKGIEYSANVKLKFNPFYCKRKASGWKYSSKNPPSRYITGIEMVGEEEQMCIMVDSEDCLYLTDNFIVTHNTYIPAVIAADMYNKKHIDKIIITRPTVACGEDLGHLPGDINEKFEPWTKPITDAMKSRMSAGVWDVAIKHNIQCIPLQLMRGRTFDNAFIICDESQNATKEQLMMLTTRIGTDSRLVISGDTRQADLRNNGLEWLIELLVRYQKRYEIIDFTLNDCVRSEVCKDFLDLYERSC